MSAMNWLCRGEGIRDINSCLPSVTADIPSLQVDPAKSAQTKPVCILQSGWISNQVCKITQQGLRCGFENTVDQFWLKHIRIKRDQSVLNIYSFQIQKRLLSSLFSEGTSALRYFGWKDICLNFFIPNKSFVFLLLYHSLNDHSVSLC